MNDPKPKKQIKAIVRILEAKGRPTAPVTEAIELATSDPTAVSELAIAVMERFPKGGTFLDAALSYLPEEEWPSLVQDALNVIEKTPGDNEAADSVIAYASLQAVSALHPHLCRIFQIRPNAGTYYEQYPWRESGEQNFEFLRSVVMCDSVTDEFRMRAWQSMLQTRHPSVIEFAVSEVNRIDFSNYGSSADEWISANLHLVGLHWDAAEVHRICPDNLYHLCFPDSYFDDESRPTWLARVHPTWNLNPSGPRVSFGGMSSGECSRCGEALHRLIDFDPLPQGLGVSGLARLDIVTCLSCLGWEHQPLFYRHSEDGCAVNVGYDGPTIKPEFPVGPLKACEGWLAETPSRAGTGKTGRSATVGRTSTELVVNHAGFRMLSTRIVRRASG